MSTTSTPAPTDEQPAVRWGLGDAWLGLLIGNVAAFVVSVIVLSATGHDPEDDLSLALIALLQVPLWAGYLGMPIWAARRKGNGVVRDFGLRARPLDVPIGLAIGVATQIVANIAYWPLFKLFGEHDLSADAKALTDQADDPLGVVLLVLIVVIGAPIIEELFFRGLLLRAAEKRWGPVWAVVVSSVVFAAIHLQPLQSLALLIVGVVLAVLALKTGRLGPSIFAHMGFNALTVIVLLSSR
jgi:membrane protease YdiL (CAAX protease family)